jgi:hypothetical protein
MQSNLIETQSSIHSVHDAPVEKPTLYDNVVPIVPVGFLVFWAIVAWVFLDIPKSLQRGKLSQGRHQKFRCRGCRYFTDNPYIQCAVHPSTALTEEAKECSDFVERDR